MIPYFSIEVSLNEDDGSKGQAANERSLRLTIARQCLDDESGADDESEIALKLAQAISWLASNAPGKMSNEFAATIAMELFNKVEGSLDSYLSFLAECGDQDDAALLAKTLDAMKENGVAP